MPITLEAPPVPMPHRDRSTRLTVFGVFTVILGGLLLAMVALTLVSFPGAAAAGTRTVSILPVVMVYGGVGALLVTLGIGSILAKRWARTLLLVGSWSLMVMGVLMVATFIVIIPMVLHLPPPQGGPPVPPGAMEIGLWIGAVFIGFFFVLVPGLWVLVYRSTHVKATCEARNPEPAWTDACPPSVLAVCLWMALGAVFMPLSVLANRAVLPFFGVFLTGWAAVLGSLVFAGLWGVAAWWIYRLDIRGWWFVVVASLVFSASNLVTYSRNNLAEMYRLMGLPPEQVRWMESAPFLSPGAMMILTAGTVLPLLIYLGAIRGHFRRPVSGVNGGGMH